MKSRNRGDRFVADTSLYKQGKCQPGSHIPIVSEEQTKKEKSGIVIIFPWNIRDVISTKLHYVSELKGKYVPFIPEFKMTGRNLSLYKIEEEQVFESERSVIDNRMGI